MPEKFYHNRLYFLQDKVLQLIQDADVDFYLTGGTALSRCYLHHRYSDDLDFFVNSHPEFQLHCNRVIEAIKKSGIKLTIGTSSEAFLRIFLEENGVTLKIDFVNDVPFRWGAPQWNSIYHRVDNWRNILSNKLCAVSRMEAKDISDIIFIARKYAFEWEDIVKEARQKDLWADPLKICRIIKEFPTELFKMIKWVSSIDDLQIEKDLVKIHDDIFCGASNSLKDG